MNKNTSLLSNSEKLICESMSSQANLEGKRAKALLALHDGDNQVIAAKKSGLSYGQVKYLLTVFRKKRMALFPEAVKEKKETAPVNKEKSKKSNPKAKKKASKKSDKKKDKKNKKKSKSKKDKSKVSGKKKDKKKKTKKSKKKK